MMKIIMEIIIFIIFYFILILILRKLNKYGFLKPIQNKIKYIQDKIKSLSNEKYLILRIVSFILIGIIYGVIRETSINPLVQGLIIGVMLVFRNECFGIDSNE